MSGQTTLKRAVRDREAGLDARALGRYTELTEADIRRLASADKWMSAVTADVENQLNRAPERLTARVSELANRYATPLPVLSRHVEQRTAKVEQHLLTMGATWL